MKTATRFLIFTFLIFASSISAQSFIRGKIIDAKDSSGIPGAQIIVLNLPDTSFVVTDQSDSTGKFSIQNLAAGKYRVKIMYVGYKTVVRDVEVTDKPVFLRKIVIEADARMLKQVDVEAVQVRQEQKGDTTIYNADAFKVNKDATTEDLVKKMPGVTIEDGQVKHQGEDVKKVLIDGKEFFGDDANMALKNIPAEMVDKISVFDRSSDQGFFSGFDDGNSQKTMNILTKNNKNNGTFGKVYGGYGTEERYQTGLNFNNFKGGRRFSIIGMSNNINVQNFGSQDLLGLTGSQGGQRGGYGKSGMAGGSYKGGGSYRGGASQNFMVGQQDGIATTHSGGINYSDIWGKKTIVTASYFFNYMDNNASSSLQRNFFSSTDPQVYSEDKTALTTNMNHRFNLRMEYFLDSMNSFVFNPRFSFQGNNAINNTIGVTSLRDTTISETDSKYSTDYGGFNSNNSLLYRKRFKKMGRTLSVQLNADLNDKTGASYNRSLNNYYYTSQDTSILLDQNADNGNGGNTYGSSISYTEPINQKWTLQLNYIPSYNINYSDKKTFNLDTVTDSHSRMDTTLTSEYKNILHTEKGGGNIRYRKENFMFSAGANYQYLNLVGNQELPYASEVNKVFLNILPTLTMQYRFTKKSNLRMVYRTSTNVPSVTQLQSVIDNSNTLMLSSGNPELKQNYSHFMMTRFNATNPTTSRSVFVFLMGNIVENYIGNSTIIALNDTILSGGIPLFKGSQLSTPVNLNGNWMVRGFSTFSTPVKVLKSTLNLNLGGSYSNLPGLINYQKNIATTTNFNTGIVIASNISEKLDFTLMWNGNYNVVKNTLQTASNNNYLFHTSSAKLNWNFWKTFHLATDVVYTYYDGLQSDFTQEFALWNNSVAWKFLKNNAGELKLSVYDALKQNNSVSRSVTETYVEDTQTKVLQRYYMLTFTWNFRKFTGQKQEGNTAPATNPTNEKH